MSAPGAFPLSAVPTSLPRVSWHVAITRSHLLARHDWQHDDGEGVSAYEVAWDWPWRMIARTMRANRAMNEAEAEQEAAMTQEEN